MFTRAPEDDDGDQNLPNRDEENDEFGFKRESEEDEADQNLPD